MYDGIVRLGRVLSSIAVLLINVHCQSCQYSNVYEAVLFISHCIYILGMHLSFNFVNVYIINL